MEISFNSVIPVLRIFNVAKADEFYLGFLGFKVDWDHRFDPIAPLYRQISRGNLILHLSEDHGDGSPGVHIRVMMDGVEAFQREISSKHYPYMKPGLETMPWGMLETHLLPGHPVHTIVALINEEHFELLVVGFMGHTRLYEQIIGSTIERLVRLAPCAVVVIK